MVRQRFDAVPFRRIMIIERDYCFYEIIDSVDMIFSDVLFNVDSLALTIVAFASVKNRTAKAASVYQTNYSQTNEGLLSELT